MTNHVPFSVVANKTISRVRSALSAVDRQTRIKLAAAAQVDEKTIRLVSNKGWNPTVKTLAALDSVVTNWRKK